MRHTGSGDQGTRASILREREAEKNATGMMCSDASVAGEHVQQGSMTVTDEVCDETGSGTSKSHNASNDGTKAFGRGSAWGTVL